MPPKPEIVPMTQAQRSFAAALEGQTFSDPWSEAAIDPDAAFQCWTAALLDGVPAGYLGAQLLFGEAEIYRIAVAPDFRRQGIARALLTAFLSREDVETAFLEVRASNAPARALYQSMGFTETSCRRNYYHAPVEDAILMGWQKPKP